ncbi:MAG: hypothetical protein C5B60_04825 [Chloroflexi bacterium]|nr:MAG: hypothetical protein C5B60_04825 [Chloroflexota bacterium]
MNGTDTATDDNYYARLAAKQKYDTADPSDNYYAQLEARQKSKAEDPDNYYARLAAFKGMPSAPSKPPPGALRQLGGLLTGSRQPPIADTPEQYYGRTVEEEAGRGLPPWLRYGERVAREAIGAGPQQVAEGAKELFGPPEPGLLGPARGLVRTGKGLVDVAMGLGGMTPVGVGANVLAQMGSAATGGRLTPEQLGTAMMFGAMPGAGLRAPVHPLDQASAELHNAVAQMGKGALGELGQMAPPQPEIAPEIAQIAPEIAQPEIRPEIRQIRPPPEIPRAPTEIPQQPPMRRIAEPSPAPPHLKAQAQALMEEREARAARGPSPHLAELSDDQIRKKMDQANERYMTVAAKYEGKLSAEAQGAKTRALQRWQTDMRFWNDELEARQRGAPEIPFEAGAAVAPPRITPTHTGMREAEDVMHRDLRSRPAAYLEEQRQWLNGLLRQMPTVNADLAREEYNARSRDELHSPEARRLSDLIQPKVDEYNREYRLAQREAYDLDMTDEEMAEQGVDFEGVPRMSLERAKFIESATEGTPLGRRALADPSAMHAAKYDVLESQDTGERRVVRRSENRLKDIITGKITKHDQGKELKYDTKIGDEKGRTWIFKRADPEEIEAARHMAERDGVGPPKELYLKNSAIVYAYGTAQLKAFRARMENLRKLKNTLVTSDFIKDTFHAPEGWKTTEFPGLRGYSVHPRVAEVLDDFMHRRTGSFLEKAEDASHWLTSTIFLTGGLPHLFNVMTHAGMAAGFRMFDPRYFGRHWGQAFHDVVQGRELYRQVLEKGGPLFFSQVRNQAFARDFMMKFGHDVKRDPVGTGFKAWAKNLGMTVSEGFKAYQRAMNAGLWFAGDWITMQSIRAQMATGRTLDQAIERIWAIPNYRVPSRIWEGPGGRVASQFLRYTPLNVFGRYHYNIAEGFGRLAKELMVGSKEQRLQALGSATALAAMYAGFKFYDAYLANYGPRDPHDPKRGALEAKFPGPLGVMRTAEGWVTGENRSRAELQRAFGFMPSPLAGAAGSVFSGVDFAGRPIVRPGASLLESLTQRGDWAIQQAGTVGQFFGGAGEGLFDPGPFWRSMSLMRKRPPKGGWEVIGQARMGQRPVGALESLVTGRKVGTKPKRKERES